MNERQRLRRLEQQVNIYFVPRGSTRRQVRNGVNLVLQECLYEDSITGFTPGFKVLRTSKRTSHLAEGDIIKSLSEVYRSGE